MIFPGKILGVVGNSGWRGRLFAAAAAILFAAVLAPEADAQDPEIRDIQERLAELGYDPGPADGFTGPRTISALEAFQEDHQLPITGRLDTETLKALHAPQDAKPELRDGPVVVSDVSPSRSSVARTDTGSILTVIIGLLIVFAGFRWLRRKRGAHESPAKNRGAASIQASEEAPIGKSDKIAEANTGRECTNEWQMSGRGSPVLAGQNSAAALATSSAGTEKHWRLQNARDLDAAFPKRSRASASPIKTVQNARDLDSGFPKGAGSMKERAAPRDVVSAPETAPAGREKKEKGGDGGWIPKGRSAVVGGRNLGGMIYVGVSPRIDQYGTRCGAYIDPALPVARQGGDFGGDGMSYWPKYSEITPTARATYLDWLASGRADPRYNVGYMFLYFYGLERRFFKDNPDTVEKREIVSEAQRLLDVYGENGSARAYLTKFMDLARLTLSDSMGPVFNRAGYDFPFSLSVALGYLVARGEPVTSDWALSWLVCHPETQLRTPAQRCEAEFRALFSDKFKRRYPNGMTVRRPKRNLTAEYRAASGEFMISIKPTEEGEPLPDVSGLRKPVNDAQEIADEATEALDKYSRFLGRNPEGRGSLEALALLPRELRDKFPSKEIHELKAWAEKIVRCDGLVAIADLIERLEGARPEKLSRRHLIGAADALALIGFAMAPDPRFALRAPKLDEPVILFPIMEDGPLSEGASDAYRSAILELALGAFVAQADGDVAPSETAALQRSVEMAKGLTEAERARLRANLAWMLAVPPDLGAFRKRLKDLDDEGRAVIRRIIIAMANADGVIRPEEIGGIEKIYRAMGVDLGEIYSDLHAGAMADEPVSVRSAQSGADGEVIPEELAPFNAGLSLDRARIADIARQTERVSRVLGDILGDRLPDEPEDSPPEIEEPPVFRGLDPNHASLVAELLERPHWSDNEYKELAVRRGLMVHGSLEAINEWSFERFDEALIEDYDGYELHPDIAETLREQVRGRDNG